MTRAVEYVVEPLRGGPTRFICLAIIADAWSRLVVGYPIGRHIDARQSTAAKFWRMPIYSDP